MNIQKVLSELNKIMTDAEIGRQIGASQSTVQRLRVGTHASTRYERAEAIKSLAQRMKIYPAIKSSQQGLVIDE
ncbi:MAG: hypothetical protein ACXV8U_03270 [Methylobacter sp.]